MRACFSGIVAFLLLVNVVICAQSVLPSRERFDLNGEWQGKFGLNAAQLETERIMIQQIGDDIVATKITGDAFVPEGKVTIRGNYSANPFQAEQVCAARGFHNPRWFPTTITIHDARHLTVHGGCGNFDTPWERTGRPTLALDSAVLFDTGKSNLRPEAENALANSLLFLRQMHPRSHLEVAGYTDDVGNDAYNLQLSRQRAASVVRWLTVHGVSKEFMTTKGFGKQNPRYPNTNDEARSKNRRVEIVVQG